MEEYKPDICIYHDKCDDGFGAAWIVNSRWDDVEFRTTNYGQPAPLHDVEGKHVLIADFSFTPATLMKIAESAASVLVLDHHKTAESMLEGLPTVSKPTVEMFTEYLSADIDVEEIFGAGAPRNLIIEFDMERSGAHMTWDFVYPKDDMFKVLKAVADRDLWNFSEEYTQKVSLYLRSISRNFDEWTDAISLFESDPDRFMAEASAIERFFNRHINEMADSAAVIEFEGYDNVPVAHVPYAFVSDVCNALLERHPDAPFAAGIVEAHGGISCGLRSSDDRVDVSEIARRHGGGGHRNAAGFRFPAQKG